FLNLHTAGGLGHAMGGLVNSQVSGTPLVVTAGRPAFLNLHTAGGLGHAMGGLVNSQVSGTPLVVTAG
ncbi:hypothetical protein CTI14_72335, partial [Methylobacterium radiotolerans]